MNRPAIIKRTRYLTKLAFISVIVYPAWAILLSLVVMVSIIFGNTDFLSVYRGIMLATVYLGILLGLMLTVAVFLEAFVTSKSHCATNQQHNKNNYISHNAYGFQNLQIADDNIKKINSCYDQKQTYYRKETCQKQPHLVHNIPLFVRAILIRLKAIVNHNRREPR